MERSLKTNEIVEFLVEKDAKIQGRRFRPYIPNCVYISIFFILTPFSSILDSIYDNIFSGVKIRGKLWELSVPLYCSQIFPKSFLPLSIVDIFGLFIPVLISPTIGCFVDRFNRLLIPCIFIFFQCGSSFIGTIMFFTLSKAQKSGRDNDGTWPFSSWVSFIFYVFVVICNVFWRSGEVGIGVVNDRDWIVVLSSEYEKNLSAVNSICLSIEWTSQIIGGVVLGFLLRKNFAVSVVVSCILYFCAFLFETFCFCLVYLTSKSLRKEHDRCACICLRDTRPCVFVFFKGIYRYFRQTVLVVDLSHIILFYTLMAPSDLFLSYLRHVGVDPPTVSWFSSLCAVFGLFGLICSPFIIRFFGISRASMFGSLIHATGIGESLIVLYLGYSIFGDQGAIYGVMATVMISQFGMTIHMLAQDQIMQLGVDEKERGLVNSVEKSVSFMVKMVFYIISLCAPNPDNFPYFGILAFLMAGLAMFMNVSWVYSKKGGKIEELNRRRN